VTMTDYLWRGLYAAPANAVLELSVRMNALQFLTIRRYLVFMFVALIVLLLVTASWI
jgi:hydrogenase-4 component B